MYLPIFGEILSTQCVDRGMFYYEKSYFDDEWIFSMERPQFLIKGNEF